MIYRVNFEHTEDGNKGYYYTTSKSKALEVVANYKKQFNGEYEKTNFDTFPTPKKLHEWIRLLNEVASHYDNG